MRPPPFPPKAFADEWSQSEPLAFVGDRPRALTVPEPAIESQTITMPPPEPLPGRKSSH